MQDNDTDLNGTLTWTGVALLILSAIGIIIGYQVISAIVVFLNN